MENEATKPASDALKVRSVDYLKQENKKRSETSLYEHDELIVRRATTFDLDVLFGNRAFEPRKDKISVCFSLGSDPKEQDGTKIVLPVTEKIEDATSWHCSILPSDGRDPKKLSLRIGVPGNAVVARYVLSLQISSQTKEGLAETKFAGAGVIVLFNPFSKGDTAVYMADRAQREEYVLNDEGFVCQGSYSSIYKQKWEFAQFDDGVLNNVLNMLQNDLRHLDNPAKSWKKRHDPVYVSRVLATMVNCHGGMLGDKEIGDYGVLWGRWDGEYSDGKNPSSWSSSAKILQQWADNGMEPVKYGQCWVFSGVLTTALRAIGIPARSITNFASAHDTDANVTIDVYYDAETGDELKKETRDSVWNFHVWNEGYFSRPDLPEGYGGWQVLDATPQEVSDVVDPTRSSRMQLYQCGPCPVKAVKEGNINIGYDTNFVFGEVNADMVEWSVSNKKISEKPLRVLKAAIGKNISTKAVGSSEREDVTLKYKYAEGTPEERESFNKAYGRANRGHGRAFSRDDLVVVQPQFQVQIMPQEKDAIIGSDLNFSIAVKNISSQKRAVDVKIAANSKRHVGLLHTLLKKVNKSVQLDAGRSTEFSFDIPHSTYMSGIVDNKVINVRVTATNPEDGNTTVEELDTTLGVPQDCFRVEAPPRIPREGDTTFDIVFENKLPITLTKGVFEVVFRGNKYQDMTYKASGAIEPREKVTISGVKIQPRPAWTFVSCTVTFESAEVDGVMHSIKLNVQ